MKQLLRDVLCIFCIFGSLAEARRLRLCRAKKITLQQPGNFTYKYYTEISEKSNGVQSIQLKVNISWTMLEQDGEIDGFLIRFAPSHDLESPSLIPTNVCDLGKDHFWVRTNNLSSCSNDHVSCAPSNDTSSQGICLCSKSNCSLLYGGNAPTCRGVDYWMSKNGGGYISIRPNIRSLVFNIDFHQAYVDYIRPYYREAVLLSGPDKAVKYDDCIEAVLTSTTLSANQASELCCRQGIPHTTARNFSTLNVIPDFKRDTVNMTVMFYPPMSQSNLRGFHIFPTLAFGSDMGRYVTPKSLKPKKIPLTSAVEDEVCDKRTFAFQTTLYDLIPGKNYDIQLSSIYEEDTSKTHKCHEGNCLVSFEISVPDIDPCEWNYCHSEAYCKAKDSSGHTTLKSTCKCKKGYEGFGISTLWNSLSNGCKSIDHCSKVRNSLLCAPNAFCSNKPAPQEGVICSCLSGYYGDGYAIGSGCSSKAILGLKIGVPVTIIFALLFIALAWKARVHKIYKKKFRFGRFQSTEMPSTTASECSPAV